MRFPSKNERAQRDANKSDLPLDFNKYEWANQCNFADGEYTGVVLSFDPEKETKGGKGPYPFVQVGFEAHGTRIKLGSFLFDGGSLDDFVEIMAPRMFEEGGDLSELKRTRGQRCRFEIKTNDGGYQNVVRWLDPNAEPEPAKSYGRPESHGDLPF